MGALESFHPPLTLKELWIAYYPGKAFSSWVGDASFRLLCHVRLWDCINCTQLPPLGQLPFLKSLWMHRLSGVKKVGEEFLRLGLGDDEWDTPIIAFPRLKSLSFTSLYRWESWAPPLPSSPSSVVPVPVKKAANADATILPRLSKLVINGCPKLEGVPPIFTTALQTLRISDCPALPSWQFLPPSIKTLELGGVSTAKLVADWPTALLSTLKRLSIEDALDLPPAVLHLSALQSLCIYGCENLRTLPEGLTRLTNLQTPVIRQCSPDLSEGCQVEGLHRPRIAHIPRIRNNPR